MGDITLNKEKQRNYSLDLLKFRRKNVLDNAGLSLNCSGLLRYVSTVIPADK